MEPGAAARGHVRGLNVVGPSFAIALLIAGHAGLSSFAALTYAIVGSSIVALLGGTTLGLSGPGLAMGLVLADVGRNHGAGGLALACLLIGIAQIVLGVRTFEVLADRGTSSGVHELASAAASAP